MDTIYGKIVERFCNGAYIAEHKNFEEKKLAMKKVIKSLSEFEYKRGSKLKPPWYLVKEGYTNENESEFKHFKEFVDREIKLFEKNGCYYDD